MRNWLDKIIKQPSTDFFLHNSEQANAFNDLKKIFIHIAPNKSACYRKWTSGFVTDKMAFLLELNQQVVGEKKAREIASGKQGKAPPQTRLRRIMNKIVKAFDKSLLIYIKA
jgi:hypothetical protein